MAMRAAFPVLFLVAQWLGETRRAPLGSGAPGHFSMDSSRHGSVL